MGFQQQHEELLALRPQIDERLRDLNFEKIKDLQLWLAKSGSFKKLKVRDNQLIFLDEFCQIWLEEKQKLSQVGIDTDIFYGVDSLESLERKYLTIQFGILRLETPMPVEYYEQAVDDFIAYHISGIALYKILMQETARREENIVKLAGLLLDRNQIATAIFLLQKGKETFPQNEDIILRLSECWLAGEQFHQAYQCLFEIEKPDRKTKELIQTLKEKLQDEENE